MGNRVDGTTAVNAGNRITRLAGYSLEYDLDGNVTRKYWTTDSTQFNQRLYWNSINQLDSARTTVAGGGTTTTRFGYDGFGRRVRKRVGTQTTWYVWQGQQVVAEYDSATGALQRHYTYYPGTDRPHSLGTAPSVRYYFLTDGRGNVGGLMNSGGTSVVAQYRYTPFGDSAYTSGTVANNVRFAGRELDPDTKLYYNRARYYDPKLGRFLSEDPIRLAGGINQYAYAGSDPINNSDPSGLDYYDCVAWGWFYWDGAAEKWVQSGPSWWECHYVPTFGPDPWNNLLWEGMSGGLPVDPLDNGVTALAQGPSCPGVLRIPGVEAAWREALQRTANTGLEEAAVVRQGSLGIPYGMQLTGAWVTAQSPTSISYLYPGDARFLIHTHPLAGKRAPGPPGSIYSWGPSGVDSAQAKVAFARVGSLQGYIVASRDSLVMLDRNMGLSSCATPP